MIREAPRGREDSRRLIEEHFLFRQLRPEDRTRLLSYARPRRVAAGQTVFLKGSPGHGMMAVLEGQVRISAPSRDGKEIVLNTIHPGEVFGEIALLDGRDRTADATALSDCEILVLERRDVLPFLEQNPKVCLQLLEVLCDRLRRTTEQVEDILFLPLPSRLAKALLRLVREPPGATELKVSQRELGAMVGGTRESVNKCLNEWQRKGIIALRALTIVIVDSDALEEIAEAD